MHCVLEVSFTVYTLMYCGLLSEFVQYCTHIFLLMASCLVCQITGQTPVVVIHSALMQSWMRRIQ